MSSECLCRPIIYTLLPFHIVGALFLLVSSWILFKVNPVSFLQRQLSGYPKDRGQGCNPRYAISDFGCGDDPAPPAPFAGHKYLDRQPGS